MKFHNDPRNSYMILAGRYPSGELAADDNPGIPSDEIVGASFLPDRASITTIAAEILYFSPSGNDSTGDGTQALPYLTYEKCAAEFIPGTHLAIQWDVSDGVLELETVPLPLQAAIGGKPTLRMIDPTGTLSAIQNNLPSGVPYTIPRKWRMADGTVILTNGSSFGGDPFNAIIVSHNFAVAFQDEVSPSGLNQTSGQVAFDGSLGWTVMRNGTTSAVIASCADGYTWTNEAVFPARPGGYGSSSDQYVARSAAANGLNIIFNVNTFDGATNRSYLVVSNDGGATWGNVLLPTPNADFIDICFWSPQHSKFVAFGQDGVGGFTRVYSSADGSAWSLEYTHSAVAVIYQDHLAFDDNGVAAWVNNSTNFIFWIDASYNIQSASIGTGAPPRGIVFADGFFTVIRQYVNGATYANEGYIVKTSDFVAFEEIEVDDYAAAMGTGLAFNQASRIYYSNINNAYQIYIDSGIGLYAQICGFIIESENPLVSPAAIVDKFLNCTVNQDLLIQGGFSGASNLNSEFNGTVNFENAALAAVIESTYCQFADVVAPANVAFLQCQFFADADWALDLADSEFIASSVDRCIAINSSGGGIRIVDGFFQLSRIDITGQNGVGILHTGVLGFRINRATVVGDIDNEGIVDLTTGNEVKDLVLVGNFTASVITVHEGGNIEGEYFDLAEAGANVFSVNPLFAGLEYHQLSMIAAGQVFDSPLLQKSLNYDFSGRKRDLGAWSFNPTLIKYAWQKTHFLTKPADGRQVKKIINNLDVFELIGEDGSVDVIQNVNRQVERFALTLRPTIDKGDLDFLLFCMKLDDLTVFFSEYPFRRYPLEATTAAGATAAGEPVIAVSASYRIPSGAVLEIGGQSYICNYPLPEGDANTERIVLNRPLRSDVADLDVITVSYPDNVGEYKLKINTALTYSQLINGEVENNPIEGVEIELVRSH